MKRSGMIKELKLYFDINTPEYQEVSETYAKSLLDLIEDLGMNPPYRKATTEDYKLNLSFDQEFLDAHDFLVDRWEPEDEG